MKYFVLFSENVSVTEDDYFVLKHKEFDAESDEEATQKARRLKNPNTRLHRMFGVSHEVTLPEFIF